MAQTKYADEWEKAKTEFESITGKSKPKPNGLIAKAFNFTGLSGDLETCEKLCAEIEAEVKDQVKKGKLIEKGKKHIPVVKKSTSSYLNLLEKATKDELADNAGAKTLYSKGLKMLKTKLDALEKGYEAKIDAYEVANSTGTGSEKASKMVHKSLIATVAIAAAAVKKVKAVPTVATFDEVFNTSDNVARKVQVQLVQADIAHKKSLLPEGARKTVDPRHVADMLTPWQAGGKGEAVADPAWTAPQVLAKLGEFSKILKLAAVYCADLDAAV